MYNRYEYMKRRGNCPKKVLKEVPTIETSDILTEETTAPLETSSPETVEVEAETTNLVETSDILTEETTAPAPRKRGRKKKSTNIENTSEVSPNSETAEGVDSNV